MPTVTLQDGESVEHDKVSFEQGLVVAYVVDEDGPPHVDNSEAVAVYPTPRCWRSTSTTTSASARSTRTSPTSTSSSDQAPGAR